MKKYRLKKSTIRSDSLERFRKELNDSQFAAATHQSGPQLIIAGAGTGKTRTLMYRVAWLISSGIAPEKIVLLSFTRKAAQEMTQRAARLGDPRCQQIRSGTFHSFANTILRRFASYLGYTSSFSICDSSDSADIIDVLRTIHIQKEERKRFPRKNTLQKVFSRAANTELSIEDIIAEDYPQFTELSETLSLLQENYQSYKKDHNIMDYDDLMLEFLNLLEKHPDALELLQKEYTHIIVDEYQDTNHIQDKIARLLAGEEGNLCVVGDDFQSIYSFRGAQHKNILSFPERMHGCTLYTLEENYRSSSQILNLSNRVMEKAQEYYPKRLYTEQENGDLPARIDCHTLQEQAEFCAQHILSLREEGIPLHKICVLFRSAYHSNELEITLNHYNIPFCKQGGIRFVEGAHIKDLLALLRIAFNPRDSISWQRILLWFEGLGSTSALRIISEMEKEPNPLTVLVSKDWKKKKFALALTELYALQKELNSESISVLSALEKCLHFYEPIMQRLYDDAHRRKPDLETLLDIASQYQDWEKFLSELSLDPPDGSSRDNEEQEEEVPLVLSTIHSAKGQEYHSVFIISLSEGYFPAPYALQQEESIEEERRLFYVALTRAQRNLYLISPRAWDKNYDFFSEQGESSRLLEEIPPETYERWELEEEPGEDE
jgi:DNA helicase-2/ATP-dependent DNA helicase PcrA